MKTITLIIGIIFISSCSKEGKKPENNRLKRLIENHEQVDALVKKYNAQKGLDTLYFASTYEFQKYLSVNNTFYINPRTIFDFAELDSIFQVTFELKQENSSDFTNIPIHHKLVMDCTLEQLKKINTYLPDKIPTSKAITHRSNASLIVRLKTAQKERYKGYTFTGEVVEVIPKDN